MQSQLKFQHYFYKVQNINSKANVYTCVFVYKIGKHSLNVFDKEVD